LYTVRNKNEEEERIGAESQIVIARLTKRLFVCTLSLFLKNMKKFPAFSYQCSCATPRACLASVCRSALQTELPRVIRNLAISHQTTIMGEISGSEKSLSDAAAAGELTADAKILNMIEFFGPLESPLQGPVTGSI
jgi:hypothetical protein